LWENEKHNLSVDIEFKIRKAIRVRLHGVIKRGKAGSAVKDLGCTIAELKRHIESQFQEGMTWDNWSQHGWHIDHIIPLSSFDLTDREQFLKACHYTNLQPLWSEDNHSKKDRLDWVKSLRPTRSQAQHEQDILELCKVVVAG